MRIIYAALALPMFGGPAAAWPQIHISAPHISAPHISVPHVNIGPVAITPLGPVPAAAIAPVQAVANAVVNSGAKVTQAVADAQVAPQVAIVNIVGGKENLTDAAKSAIKSEGAPIGAVGQAVNDTNAATQDLKVIAAQSIAGNVGKTVINIVDGPTQLEIEYAATTAIEAGEIAAGKLSPERVVAAPLAAAIRTAYNQYNAEAKAIPDGIRASLAPFFSADTLNNARWTVSSISIAVPDLIDQGNKTFQGSDYAVTVGHITVFNRDPGDNIHWWAHEIQHQVQYANWGIDDFAYRYVVSCHNVEGDAEAKAQAAFPVTPPVAIAC